MSNIITTISFFALLTLTICHTSAHGDPTTSKPPRTIDPTAQPPQPQPPPNPATKYLDAHNQARASVGVNPLIWSEKLANASSQLVRYQRNEMGCQLASLENLYYGLNQLQSGLRITPTEAVDIWVDQKIYYNYANNTCAPSHMCGLYTQVVWRNSSELGCARATCVWGRKALTICLYNPPGNEEGVKPY